MGGSVQAWRWDTSALPARRLWLAGGVVVLNVLDVLLTKAVLHHGGIEANPLMQGLMAGMAAPLGLKMMVAGLAGILLLLCPAEARIGERAMIAVVALYSLIVVWNSVVLGLLILS